MREMLRAGLMMGALLFAWGCGGGVGVDGDVVGGSCRDDRDCDPEGRCLRNDDFPGGQCTLRCGNDGDCPSDTYCIEREGGVCALACQFSDECRGGYECKGQRSRERNGDRLVCIGD